MEKKPSSLKEIHPLEMGPKGAELLRIKERNTHIYTHIHTHALYFSSSIHLIKEVVHIPSHQSDAKVIEEVLVWR